MSDQKKSLERVRRELVRFRLLPDSGWLGGVCAAIAYRLGIPTWLVRLIWAGLILCKGVGLLLYVVLWIFIPNSGTPSDYVARTGDGDD